MNTAQQIPEGHTGWRTAKGPHPDNRSGLRATGHRVLLATEVVEKKTKSGIVLAEKTVQAEKNQAVWCRVVEIGPDSWMDKTTDFCKVGDRVLVGQFTGVFREGPRDGAEYRFVNDLDIISPEVTFGQE